MAPRNILITGANHSVGFSLVKEVLKCSEVRHLFGAATRPSESLRKIQDSRFHYLEMTVTSDESIRDAYEKVKDILGDDGLNLLINDHGVMMEYYFDERPGRQSFLRQLDINTASVLVITQIFLPLIEIAARNCPSSELSVDRAAVINVSSTLGSTENNNGEWKNKNMMIFKASKAALNSVTKEISFDLLDKGILTAAIGIGSLHGSLFENGIREQNNKQKFIETASAILSTLTKLGREQTGGYFDTAGKALPY